MKKVFPAVVVFFTCFAAVLAALQINRLLDDNQPGAAVTPIYKTDITPVGLQTLSGGAVDFREAAKKVTPSVVTVDQFRSDMYGGGGSPVQTGTGSGVIFSADGIIVTNNHVVRGAQEVKVKLSDNRTFPAKVIGRDSRSDIAVLKIETTNLTPIEMGDSTKLEVGQWVVAVGNPLGLDNTVSVGVVSSLGRSLGVENSVMTDAIQTDAAINPGNSGGALTDASGRLIGINAAIAGRSNIGIGFAIPVNRIKKIVKDIRDVGYARYAGLGINYNPQSTGLLTMARFRSQYAAEMGAEPPKTGIIVGSVSSNSSADKAGVKAYDILLSIDGRALNDPLVLSEVLNRKSPGDKVTLKFWSKGETKTASVALMEIRPIDD